MRPLYGDANDIQARQERFEELARHKSPLETYHGHPRLDVGLDYAPAEFLAGEAKNVPQGDSGSKKPISLNVGTIRAALFDVLDANTRELYAHDCEHHRVTDEEASENRYLLADMLIRRIGEIQKLHAKEQITAQTETKYDDLSYLKRIIHAPARDDEIESYARGVIRKMLDSATPNTTASLLSRIRSDTEQLIRLREESLKGICVYCGEIQQYESPEQKSGEEGNRIRVEHIKQCPQRPELKLIAYCEELQEAAKAAHGWIARVSNQYFLGADDPHDVLAQLNAVLNPKPPQS